jgi:hypothetical protein
VPIPQASNPETLPGSRPSVRRAARYRVFHRELKIVGSPSVDCGEKRGVVSCFRDVRARPVFDLPLYQIGIRVRILVCGLRCEFRLEGADCIDDEAADRLEAMLDDEVIRLFEEVGMDRGGFLGPSLVVGDYCGDYCGDGLVVVLFILWSS